MSDFLVAWGMFDGLDVGLELIAGKGVYHALIPRNCGNQDLYYLNTIDDTLHGIPTSSIDKDACMQV